MSTYLLVAELVNFSTFWASRGKCFSWSVLLTRYYHNECLILYLPHKLIKSVVVFLHINIKIPVAYFYAPKCYFYADLLFST